MWWPPGGLGGTLGADCLQHKTLASARGKRELDHFVVPEAETGDTELSRTGVSILMSYGENPHYVKLPIFSEFMENSTKFMNNSDLTKWTQNLR